MDNPYDQFDAPQQNTQTAAPTANPYDQFDQFDAKPQTQDQTPAPEQSQQKPGFWEGVKRGAQQFDVGTRQLSGDLLNAFGANVDPNDMDTLNRAAQQLEKEGEGTGIMGTAGEMVGDPSSYIPFGGAEIKGAKALAKTGAKLFGMGVESGATAPSQDDQGLLDREENALKAGAYSIPLGLGANAVTRGLGRGTQAVANWTGLSNWLAGKLSSNPSVGDIYEMANRVGLPTDNKTPEEIWNGIKDWHQQNIDAGGQNIINETGAPNSDLDPVAANMGISRRYNDAVKEEKRLYDNVSAEGEGNTVFVKGLQTQLNGTIAALQNKQFKSASEESALQKLQNIQANLGKGNKPYEVPISTGETLPASKEDALANKPATATVEDLDEVGLNDLVDLKQALNEGFDPSKWPKKGDIPQAQLFRNVKNALDEAGKQYPDFADALQHADDFHTDRVKTFDNNPVMEKFWTKDDHNAFQQLDRTDLPDATRQRANAMFENIRTPQDITSLYKALPPDMAQQMMATKFKQMMSDAGIDADKITEAGDTLEPVLRRFPQTRQLYNNIKEVAQALNDRGITDNVRVQEPDQSGMARNATVALVAAKQGKIVRTVSELMSMLGKKEGNAAAKRLSAFQNEMTTNPAGRQGLKPVTNAVATQAGKQTAIGLGDVSENQDIPRVTVRPSDRNLPPQMGYARGGAVYEPAEWLTLVRKHGKEIGVNFNQRLKPEAVEKMNERIGRK